MNATQTNTGRLAPVIVDALGLTWRITDGRSVDDRDHGATVAHIVPIHKETGDYNSGPVKIGRITRDGLRLQVTRTTRYNEAETGFYLTSYAELTKAAEAQIENALRDAVRPFLAELTRDEKVARVTEYIGDYGPSELGSKMDETTGYHARQKAGIDHFTPEENVQLATAWHAASERQLHKTFGQAAANAAAGAVLQKLGSAFDVLADLVREIEDTSTSTDLYAAQIDAYKELREELATLGHYA